MTDSASRPANRLAYEKSPYLLQHARNPVDWYPWGEEAFARARAEDKPIFLSIGYSTCHWCHVMERESFENEAVAGLLNAHFVPVKVDREERPDVDRLYMASAQAMGVGGGWPLTMFLTPQLEPFHGGTYFPPESRGGRLGLTDLLPRVHAAWLEQRAQIAESGARVLARVGSLAEPEGEAPPHDALALECVRALERSFDAAEGGFGSAPKFPSTANLAFLFRWWARDPETRGNGREMALRQLDAMQAGGIHDHVGGGFHRYSTDRGWRVPHFEKMLYDQALIADAYLDGFEITRAPGYAATLRALFGYVRRELASPEGAFWSAEDADSEGEEGRCYVWTPAQLAGALGEADATFAAFHWGVTPQGNFEHGASVLHEAHGLERTAAHFGLTADETRARLDAVRGRLLAARAARVRPHLDDKVLAAWNGLMIAAMARGARVLLDDALAHAAARAAAFAWDHLRDPASGALWRRWRGGEAAVPGQLDDHAYVARGFLELHAATHEVKWLERAVALTEVMFERFWDDDHGAFFDSPAGDASVRVRMKDGFDGAELAGNSVAALNLVRLSALLPREGWRARAQRTLDYHARRLSGSAWAMPMMLVAMDLAARPPRHIVIAGEPSPGRDALLAVYDDKFRPFDDRIVVDDRARAALSELAPFTARLRPLEDRATAFVCLDRECRLPATDPETFAAQLDDRAPAGAETENA